MYRLYATIPDDLPGPRDLRTLPKRLGAALSLKNDGLRVHPDDGSFSVTKETRKEIDEVLKGLRARDIHIRMTPFLVHQGE